MNVYKCDDCANQRTEACNTCMSTHGRKPTEFKAKESGNMANVTVLTDELGLQREYREVKRKAAVGERIKYVYPDCEPQIFAVIGVSSNGDVDIEPFTDTDGDECVGICYSAYFVLEPSDIVIVDNERYRLVERKANVGERVVVVSAETETKAYKNGDVMTVTDSRDTGVSTNETWVFVYHREYRVLEPVASDKLSAKLTVDIGANPDVIGLIANLSTRLAEAERKIAALEGVQAESRRYIPVVSGPVTDDLPSFATRDDVIERAKADVAELLKVVNSDEWRTSGIPEHNRCGALRYEFYVNRDKRTVVAIGRLKHFSVCRVYNRGIAKCAPDDVFNTHIGRAIALRRALGLKVPDEYVNAPKPTEAKVGDIVAGKGRGWSYYSTDKRFTLTGVKYGETDAYTYAESATDWIYKRDIGSIIDDSREEVTA